jgi:starvation-inducible DNA-binding protein
MKKNGKYPEDVAQTQIDNGMAKTKPIKLGWTTEEIAQITVALNAVLANYMVHYQKLRNYHWNVKGPEFFDLHDQFEKQYTQALANIDDLAERIRIFGEPPLSLLRDYLETSEIKETGSNLPSEIMVRELLSDHRILLQYLYAAVDVAASHEDSGTEEMLKVFINQLEKTHWMLSAFLANN